MALRKNDNANLRNEYSIWVEVGMVVTLVLLITAFRFNVQTEKDFEYQMEEQEVVQMEEVQQTKQEVKPPPPPKPPVPVEVPNDEIIEDNDVDFDASLDLSESLDTSEGPPAPPEEEEEEEEIFVVVENQPDCGGVAALQSEVEYPEFAKKAGIEGRVFLQFVVDKSGNVTNPRVTRGVHKLLDQEALRAVRTLQCTPGKQRGEAVKVQMSLPVTFRLR